MTHGRAAVARVTNPSVGEPAAREVVTLSTAIHRPPLFQSGEKRMQSSANLSRRDGHLFTDKPQTLLRPSRRFLVCRRNPRHLLLIKSMACHMVNKVNHRLTQSYSL